MFEVTNIWVSVSIPLICRQDWGTKIRKEKHKIKIDVLNYAAEIENESHEQKFQTNQTKLHPTHYAAVTIMPFSFNYNVLYGCLKFLRIFDDVEKWFLVRKKLLYRFDDENFPVFNLICAQQWLREKKIKLYNIFLLFKIIMASLGKIYMKMFCSRMLIFFCFISASISFI